MRTAGINCAFDPVTGSGGRVGLSSCTATTSASPIVTVVESVDVVPSARTNVGVPHPPPPGIVPVGVISEIVTTVPVGMVGEVTVSPSWIVRVARIRHALVDNAHERHLRIDRARHGAGDVLEDRERSVQGKRGVGEFHFDRGILFHDLERCVSGSLGGVTRPPEYDGSPHSQLSPAVGTTSRT